MSSSKPTKSMWKRMIVILCCVLVVLFGVSGISLTKIMIVDSDFYQEKASEQQLYDTEIAAKRGDIYDCNMNVLATSATVYTVYITPNNIKSKVQGADKQENVREDIAKHLSEILSMEFNDVLVMAKKDTSYATVKKQVEKPEADKIRKYISKSDLNVGQFIGLDEATKRYYPNDSLASEVLGFVGTDNQGLGGVEAYYDTELTGTPGRVVAAKDAKGADMPFSYETEIEAEQGSSLVLTIDKYVQYVAEKYIEQAVEDNNAANRGMAVVMNVNTGAILGMAVKGDFNPNDAFTLSNKDQEAVDATTDEVAKKTLKSDLLNKQWRNKAVSDTYEPGSVFKVITAAAALEENEVNLESSFNCPGYIVIAGQRYSCHKKSGHGVQNFTEAVSNSCNPAFIEIGQKLGVSKFFKYFNAFGLTQKTGIDLPGESDPVYHKEANMGPVELASTSFGQTIKVTPVQMISAFSATINGGYLVQPHVVNKVLDSEGNVTKTIGTSKKRQVVSNETSKIMQQVLEKVVDGGGGKNAYVTGYRIGGKTGTSQKVAENLESGQVNYIGSFCGFAPADDPEIAILVIVDEPDTSIAYYGSAVSAPPAGQMFAEILPYLGNEPQYTAEQLESLAQAVPDVIENNVDEAKSSLVSKGLNVKVVGDGDKVVDQLPLSSQSICRGGTVVLYTEKTSEKSMATVPDFGGMTVSAVNSLAASAGINVEFSGANLSSTGVGAYRQSVAAGEQIESGTIITVYFRTGGLAD